MSPFFTETLNNDWGLHSSPAGSIQWPCIKDIYTLHFAEDFESLKTSRLFIVGRDGAGVATGTDKILLGLDLYLVPISGCFGGRR